MAQNVSGNRIGSAYLGVNALFPPDGFRTDVDPTQYDTNFNLLDLWLNEKTQIAFILVSLAGNSSSAGPQATWIPLTGASGGGISEVIPDAGIPIVPTAMGEIFAFGGLNINTFGGTNTLTVNLDDSISLPATSTDASSGVISIGPAIAIQMIGTANVFVASAGNLNVTGVNNVGMGEDSLDDLSTGSNNTGYGVGSGSQITTGSNNIILGYASGSDYTSAESSNICIGNVGVNGDENTMRLGTSGSGARQIDTTHIAGVFGNILNLGSNNGVVIVDNTDLAKMTRGENGQILIGANSTGPDWGNITSTGNTIAITNGAGTINIESVGGGTAINCAFLAHNATNVPNVTGDGTVFTYINLNEIFDVGNNFNPTTGIFTAPTTSQYYLEITVDLTNLSADGGADAIIGTAQIVTTARTYVWNYGPESYAGTPLNVDTATISFQQIVNMAEGDTATFTISTNNNNPPGNKVIGLGVNSWVSGYLVSGAGVGILQIDTNSGSAVPSMGILSLLGGQNILTHATGPNTITVDVDGCTNHSLQIGNSTGSLNNLGVALNGQIPIGSTGADPVLNTITAGTNITVVNGSGTITISATGGGAGTTWNAVTGTTQTMVVNNGYYTQNTSLTTLTLPTVAAAGTILEVLGQGAGGWVIACNAGQTIYDLTATTSSGGVLGAVEARAAIKIVCVVANTTWGVATSNGNFNLA